jgi:photosystem II stability/assembly factor-like uncharacterized protein
MSWSRARVVTLVVCALVTISCQGTTQSAGSPSASPSAAPEPTKSHTPSPSPSPTGQQKKHSYVTVTDFQSVSSSVAVAVYEDCTAKPLTTTCESHLALSTDLGRAWNDMTPPLWRAASLEHPYFLDADRGWVAAVDCVGGNARIYRTMDGGITWQHTVVQPPSCNGGAGIFPRPIDDALGYYTTTDPASGAEGGVLFRSTDGGASFGKAQHLPVGGSLTQPPSFESPTSAWMTGVDQGRAELARSLDSGESWVEHPLPSAKSTGTIIAPWQPPTFAGASGVVPVYSVRNETWRVTFDRSDDAGASWNAGRSITSGERYPPNVAVVDPRTWWLASRRGTVTRTTDAGNSWTEAKGPTGMKISGIAAIDQQRAWLTASGGAHQWLFLTMDGGRTWTRIRPDRLPLRTVTTLPHTIMDLAVGPDGSLYSASSAGRRAYISRIEPSTGATLATTHLPGSGVDQNTVAVFGGSVWFAGQSPFDHRPPHILFRLDPRTLEITGRFDMGAAPSTIVGTPFGVWVGAGHEISMLDPSGNVVHRIRIAGLVMHVAVDPTGTRLFVSTRPSSNTAVHSVFEERLASSGTLLASSFKVCCPDLNGPSAIAPATDGVWVTTPTGMMGMIQQLRDDDLTPTPLGGDEGSWTGVNGMSAVIAGDVLWILDMGASITCVNPTTGQVAGRMGSYPSTELAIQDVVSLDGRVLLANSRSIQQLSPDSRCLTSSA